MSSNIEYTRFRRGEGCTEEGCRARKFYIADGKKFCQRGHEQANFLQTQQDEDDWNTAGKRSRKKKEEKEHVVTILSGSEAKELYLHCYQLILWKQCHWLVNVKKFPPELETIVRDLWGLRLGLFSKSTAGTKSGYGSGTGTATGSMMYSSATETENTDTDGTGFKSESSRRSRRSAVGEEKLPRLVETLGLCYLATLLLRLPTSLGDFYNWAAKEEIIYNRAIKEVPKEMRTKLPPYFHSALEIRAPLKQSNLSGTVLELIEFFHLQFEMVFPPLNHPLLQFKHIRDLGLPIEIYPAVTNLSKMLNLTFSFPILHKKIYGITSYPETKLVCLIIIATKLSHPFDAIPRIPTTSSSPAATRINWSSWRQIMAEKPTPGLRPGEEIKVTDMDVMSMSGEKIDDYLDWYQRTWIDDKDPKIATQILDLFPLEELEPMTPQEPNYASKIERLKEIQSTLVPITPIPETEPSNRKEKIFRPGELYKRYRAVEELPSNAKAFYELASSNSGITLKTLVQGVYHLEVQISNWLQKAKREKICLQDRGVNRDIEMEDRMDISSDEE